MYIKTIYEKPWKAMKLHVKANKYIYPAVIITTRSEDFFEQVDFDNTVYITVVFEPRFVTNILKITPSASSLASSVDAFGYVTRSSRGKIAWQAQKRDTAKYKRAA